MVPRSGSPRASSCSTSSFAASRATSASTRSPAGCSDASRNTDRLLTAGSSVNTASTFSVKSVGVVTRMCNMGSACLSSGCRAFFTRFAGSAADVDLGTSRRIRFGAAQDLMSQRRDVPLTGEQEPQHILAGSLLRPLEVDVGRHVVAFADREQHRGQHVRDAGARGTQYSVRPDADAGDLHGGGELAGVGDLDLEEDRGLGQGEVVVQAHVEGLLAVLLVVSGLG